MTIDKIFNEEEAMARLLQVPISDKLKYVNTMCAWCYQVGKTEEGKEVYFLPQDMEKVKEIFNSHKNPSHTICTKDKCIQEERLEHYKEIFKLNYQDT